MWTCPKCKRVFHRTKQQHSCASKSLKEHFRNKKDAFLLYGHLLKTIRRDVGKVKEISLPCCIHLFGSYDFLAVLPKKDGVLEIRFALDRKLKNKRIFAAVPVSKSSYKNCLTIQSSKNINPEFIEWLRASYQLKT